jgi:hypothetical protein
MLTALLPLALGSGPQTDASSRVLLRAMVKKYASNVSMTGQIVNAVSDGTGIVTTITDFSYIKPSRIILVQKTDAKKAGSYRLASDGLKFSYDRPIELSNDRTMPDRVVEPVRKDTVRYDKQNKPYVASFYMMTVADMYIAASHSMPDAGPVHDIVFGVGVNTDSWLKNVVSLSAPEPSILDGEKVRKISGVYRSVRVSDDATPVSVKLADKLRVSQEMRTVSVPATFTFYLTSDNLIKRFMTVETYLVAGKEVKLASVWDPTVTLNPDIPLKAFSAY